MSFGWKTMPLLERLENMASGNYYEEDIREAITKIASQQAVVDAARVYTSRNDKPSAPDWVLEGALRDAIRALDGEVKP